MLGALPDEPGAAGGGVTSSYLVVDDSRAMRAYISGALLSSLDCRVDEASSGFEALRLFPRGTYDAVIADINMPDINGFELIRHLRASERQGDVAIIIISTQRSQRDVDRALALGANLFLCKPFTPEEIVRAITSCAPRSEALS
jgi:two-component system, chemotaxis family, chemotaxis protein CheY